MDENHSLNVCDFEIQEDKVTVPKSFFETSIFQFAKKNLYSKTTSHVSA